MTHSLFASLKGILAITLAVLSHSPFARAQSPDAVTILVPERIFDGVNDRYQTGRAVIIKNGTIVDIIAKDEILTSEIARQAHIIELPGKTLMPGLIDLHSHVLLHPYDEVSWNDQVLKETIAERSIRAANHLKATLFAGYTTLRDLGSEGAGYADVGVRETLKKGVIPGPRLLVAGKAIVATGSYGPGGFAEQVTVPLGAEPADGADLVRVTRDQIGHGVDFIKIYADYRWGPDGSAQPTFSIEEIASIVATARSSGRYVVAHAATAEGMRRAVLGGVETIEHGDAGTKEIFQLMRERGVAWCPTLAAGEAISMYRGWKKGEGEEPARITKHKQSFKLALKEGVTMCAGSDVGVFDHGDNAWELELMVEYGMKPLDVMRSATSINARLLHLGDQIGQVKKGFKAELIAVDGDPMEDIRVLKNVSFVMQGQQIIKNLHD